MADRGQPISDVFDVPVIKSQYETVIGYVDSLAERMQKFNADNEKLGGANTFAGINTSIKETTKALPELAAAQEKVYQSEAKLTILLAQKQKTYTELGLATNEYKKQSDALATTEAKLSVATSDEAKALAAKSVELKEARKALIDEAKANNDSVKARIASKQAALDEAKAAKQAAADKKKADADIVAATRDKLKAQQDEARQAKINQKIEADLKDERKQLTLVLKQQEQEYYAVARAKGRDSDEAKTALASSTATRKIINELDQDLGNYQKNVGNYFGALQQGFGYLRTIAQIVPALGIQGEFQLIFEGITLAVQALGFFSDAEEKARKQTEMLTDAQLQLLDSAKQYSELNTAFYGNYNKDLENQLSLSKANGDSSLKQLGIEEKLAKQRAQNAQDAIDNNEDNAQSLRHLIKAAQDANTDYALLLKDRTFGTPDGKPLNDEDYEKELGRRKKFAEATKQLADAAQARFEESYTATAELTAKERELQLAEAESEKSTADNLRKFNQENLKARLADKIAYEEAFADASALGVLTEIAETKKAAADRKELLQTNASDEIAQLESDRDFKVKNDQLTDNELKRLESETAASIKNINTQLSIDLINNQKKASDQIIKIKAAEVERLKNLVPPPPPEDLDTTPDRFQVQKHSLEQQSVISATFYTQEQTKLDAAHNKGEISDKKYYDESLKIQKSGLGKQLDLAEASLGNLFRQNADLIQRREELKSLLDINKLVTPGDTEGQNKIKKEIQELDGQIQQTNDTINTTTQSVTNLQAQLTKLGLTTPLDKLSEKFKVIADDINAVFAVIGKAIENNVTTQKNAVQQIEDSQQKNYEAEVERVNNSTLNEQDKSARLIQLEAQRSAQKEANDRKERLLDRKKAEFDKAANIANIITGTALAVINTLKDPKLIALGINIPAAIAVGAIGAAELAVAAAAPIPAFKKGGKVKKDGVIQVSEEGRELAIAPDGSLSLTPDKPSLIYAKKGTEIIRNEDVDRVLIGLMMKNTAQRIQGEESKQIDMSETNRYLRQLNKKKWVSNINISLPDNDWYRRQIKN